MESVRDGGYFGFHYTLLKFLGIGTFHNPRDNNFDNYPTKLYLMYGILSICINIVGYTASETVFAIKVWQEGREASLQFLALTMVGVHTFATIKILILIKNNKKIQKIVRALEVDAKKFSGDKEILDRSKFLTKVVTGCFFIMGELTITCMIFYTITVDIERKKRLRFHNNTLDIPRDTPFTAYVPWDTNEDIPYVMGFLYCALGMYWMGSTLIICDTMIASIMVHISGQFKMVQKVIENIGENAIDILVGKLDQKKVEIFNGQKSDTFAAKKKCLLIFYTQEDFNKAIIQCLRRAIQYHQLIIDITKDLQEAYSQAFLCQTLSSFYVIGLILVQTAQDVSNIYSLRFFNTLGFLTSILWQLFSQTYSANEITLQAKKVAESAYSSPWYEVGRGGGRIGRLIIILIQKAGRPIHLTAGKFSPMSNELFVTIIRSAYQIFTLITTVMSGDK